MWAFPGGKGKLWGKSDWRRMLDVDRLKELKRKGRIQNQGGLQR